MYSNVDRLAGIRVGLALGDGGGLSRGAQFGGWQVASCLERMVELIHWSKYLYIVGNPPAEDVGLAWRIR